MADLSVLEQRLASLEREVAQIKRHFVPTGRGANWVDEFAGSMKDFPEFSEVVRLGREFRASQEDPAH